MLKSILFIGLLLVACGAQAQHVGVNQPTPVQPLHVTGTTRLDSALVLHPATTLAPGAAPEVPNRVSTISLSNNATPGDANALVAPTEPIEGQLLTILNLDDDAATFEGVGIAASSGINVYQYLNSAWRLLSKSPVSGGPKVYYVAGTTDISISNSIGLNADIPEMTLTLTPENAIVLVTFSASGELSGTTVDSRINFWFDINKDGTNIRRNITSIITGDAPTFLPQRWDRTFTVPVSVTVGSPTTLKVRWGFANTGTGTVTFTNNASSATYYRLLTIQDGPLN